MDDASEAVESLRALAAWLDAGFEPDPDDRAAVQAWWTEVDKAAETLGELADWDEAVLRQAAGVVGDDEELWPGHYPLLVAACNAEDGR